jgi:hypothetical protein
MAAVKLSFTWLGVRKTLAPEQRTTAARAFHADRELLSASKLILDTKNPAYRAVAAVRSEASGYWRTVTLPFPEAGIRLLPQSALGMFASTMQTYRERLQETARELSSQYDPIKSEAQRRLGTLFNASDYPTTLDGLFDLEVSYPTIEPPNYLMALHPDVYQAEPRPEAAAHDPPRGRIRRRAAPRAKNAPCRGHSKGGRDPHQHPQLGEWPHPRHISRPSAVNPLRKCHWPSYPLSSGIRRIANYAQILRKCPCFVASYRS